MEPTIHLTTTGTMIIPYVKGQLPFLEKYTSSYEKITHSWNPANGFIAEDMEAFLTYKIPVSKLKAWFPDYEIVKHSASSSRSLPKEVKMNDDFELRELQKKPVTSLIATNKPEVFLNIPTATGKTVIGVFYSIYFNKRTLIVCFSTKILNQWKEAILSMTNVPEKSIKVLNSDYIHKVVNDEYDFSDDYFLLSTPQLFSMYSSKNGYADIMSFMTKMRIGLKIFDEAHRDLGAIVKLNALSSCEKTLYMSADLNRGSRYIKDKFFNVFGSVQSIQFSEDDMKKLRHILAVFVNFNSNPDPISITNVRKGKYNWSHIAYAKYQYDHSITSSKVIKLINKILSVEVQTKPRYKILVLLELIDHVDQLTEDLRDVFKGRVTVGRYHSKVSPEEKKETLECDIIVSIYDSFSTGVNVVNPEIRHVISTIPVNEVTINQSAGRCRPINGLNSFLWILCDTGFDYCVHNKSRVGRYLSKQKIKSVIEKDFDQL